MAYADYEFYTNEYFGNSISADDFPRLSARASDYVYSYTQGLSDTVKDKDLEMVKKATCAVAEVLLDESIMEASAFSGEQSVSNESVGSWSKSYSSGSMTSTQVEYIEKRKLDALMLYLGNLAAFASLFKVRSYPCAPRRRCV